MGRREIGLGHLKATKALFGVVVWTPMPFVLPLDPLIFLCKSSMVPIIYSISALQYQSQIASVWFIWNGFVVGANASGSGVCLCGHGSRVMFLVKHREC